MKNLPRPFIAVWIFAIFFGLLEAVVAIYLRLLFGINGSLVPSQLNTFDIAFNLGFITFLQSSVSLQITHSLDLLHLEMWREFATIVILAALAWTAGKKYKDKCAYFLLAFGVWDIAYYIFLKVLSGWPTSIFNIDIYFFIPVAWIGPVITPVSISITLIAVALWLLPEKSR